MAPFIDGYGISTVMTVLSMTTNSDNDYVDDLGTL